MKNLAIAILDGNLVRDPETKQTKNEKTVTRFAVALNHEWGAKDGDKAVSFVDVECWDRLAETCAQYLKKGRYVTVTGQLRQDRWKDNDGKSHSRLKIVAQNVRFGFGERRDDEKAA